MDSFDTFDTFDGSKPNLISKTTLKELEKTIGLNNNEMDDKMLNGIGSFYENYISPNLFPIIVICLLILYLTIKYIIKRDRDEKNKKIKLSKTKIIKQPINDNKQTNDKKIIENNTEIVDNDTNSTPDISNIISEDYILTDSE